MNGLSGFALEFHQQCSESNDKNIIISPFSVAAALALLSQSANGNSFEELRKILHLGTEKAKNADQFFEFWKQIEQGAGSTVLSVVNQIYIKKGLKLNNDFREIALKKFCAGIESVDFTKSEETAETINRFVGEKTMDHIKKAVTPDLFDSLTIALLLNVIYFNAKWTQKFDAGYTREGRFYTSETRSVPVQYMNKDGVYKYVAVDDLGATALEMDYIDSEFSFMIILPNSRTGLRKLESRLKDYDLSKIVDKMTEQFIKVKVPKFKYEFDIELNETLKKMGVNDIFTDSADLSGLLDPSTPSDALYVSKVVHKAFIDFNEEGTEAGAVTYVLIKERCLPPQPKIKFTVEHPFFFVIRSKSVKSMPIFCGSVNIPIAGKNEIVSERELNWQKLMEKYNQNN